MSMRSTAYMMISFVIPFVIILSWLKFWLLYSMKLVEYPWYLRFIQYLFMEIFFWAYLNFTLQRSIMLNKLVLELVLLNYYVIVIIFMLILWLKSSLAYVHRWTWYDYDQGLFGIIMTVMLQMMWKKFSLARNTLMDSFWYDYGYGFSSAKGTKMNYFMAWSWSLIKTRISLAVVHG